MTEMTGLTKDEIKNKVCAVIAAHFDQLKEVALAIGEEPELGYKEEKTSAKVQAAFEKMGLPFTTGHGLTGVKARLKGKESRCTVAMMGELDAIICPKHPGADPLTGAAHCCGHNVQIANLLAVGIGLKESGAMDYLGGDVVLFAVPAEEYVEIDYRHKLREEGKIRYLGGKQQLISTGDFDDIDLAMQMHVQTAASEEGEMTLGRTSNGFIGKLIEYHGRAAHAAGAPDQGINALNAAMMGLMGVNAIRDTFRENEYFRFHPIINHGGDLVNVVPDLVTMESYVRASTVEAMIKGNKKVNRALKAGADAVGATCQIDDLPGYLPLRNDQAMNDLLEANSKHLFGETHVKYGPHATASTDAGDLSHLMPVIHPWVGCVEGALHGSDYRLVNEDVAYTKTAQALAMTIIDLLYDDAAEAEKIVKDFKPVFTRESYTKFLDSIDEAE